jgi:hypothetical protein
MRASSCRPLGQHLDLLDFGADGGQHPPIPRGVQHPAAWAGRLKRLRSRVAPHVIDHEQHPPLGQGLPQQPQPVTGRTDLDVESAQSPQQGHLGGDQVGMFGQRHPEHPVREVRPNLLVLRHRRS